MKLLLICVLSIGLVFALSSDPQFSNWLRFEMASSWRELDKNVNSAVQKCKAELNVSAANNVQRTACYAEELDRLDALRAQVMKALTRQTTALARHALGGAQAIWRGSREVWCRYIEKLPIPPMLACHFECQKR